MRVGVNGILVRDGKILVVEINDETGLHYNLPGGGVDEGEELHDALKRELLEEASLASVTVGRLVLVWEYLPTTDYTPYGTVHKIHHLFEVHTDDEPVFPTTPDANHTALKWLPLDELATAPLLPNLSILKDLLEHPQETQYIKI